jgi:hypothetical protein
MTDIEAKALALVREVLTERDLSNKRAVRREVSPYTEALCRAIEQHEAFRQEVSDAVELSIDRSGHDGLRAGHINEYLGRFIIPKPKPDPLREIAEAWGLHNTVAKSWVEDLRATLEARGFEIREKKDD